MEMTQCKMHVRVSISHNQVWQRRKKNDCIQSTWSSAALQVQEPGETPRKDKQSTLPVFPLNAIFGHFKNISVPLLKLLSKEIFACFVFCPIEIGVYERIWYVCLKKCFLIRCERVELLNFAPKMSKFIGFEVKTFGKFHDCTWDDDFFNREKESKDDEANTLSK